MQAIAKIDLGNKFNSAHRTGASCNPRRFGWYHSVFVLHHQTTNYAIKSVCRRGFDRTSHFTYANFVERNKCYLIRFAIDKSGNRCLCRRSRNIDNDVAWSHPCLITGGNKVACSRLIPGEFNCIISADRNQVLWTFSTTLYDLFDGLNRLKFINTFNQSCC